MGFIKPFDEKENLRKSIALKFIKFTSKEKQFLCWFFVSFKFPSANKVDSFYDFLYMYLRLFGWHCTV